MNAQRDVLRQTAVIAAVTFMLIAAMVGTGLLGGTPVQQLQDGALDADSTVLAPARNAFSIWSVIYLGLIAYAVWQALPAQRTRTRQRRLGWIIALTAVLNGVWLVAAQFSTLLVTVVAIVVLLVALAVAFRRTVRIPGSGWASALLIDGVTGLHLGWVTLATVANVTAWLTRTLPPEAAGIADTAGVVVLVVVGLIGVAIGWVSGGRIAPALALTWGLVWIAVGRLAGEPSSPAVGTTAVIVAGIVLLAAVARRLTVRRGARPRITR